MKWAVALLLYVAGLFVAGAQEAPVAIGGTVVNFQTGAPMEGVRVWLALTTARDREAGSALTKADGRFAFRVPKGEYSLWAERNDLGRQPYGARALGAGVGVAIIADGSVSYDQLQLRVHLPGAIRGRVTDQDGEPVENALVQLLQVWYPGKRQTMPRAYFYTDDRGAYRFGNLGAGEYYMVVGGTPWHSQAVDDAALGPRAAYAPVYYPNTMDPKGAGSIVVKAAEEAVADFTLREQAGRNLLVKVTGPAKDGGRVMLTAEGVAGVNRFQFDGYVYGGELRIPAVPAGSYSVTVTGSAQRRPVAGVAKVDVAGQADATVTVETGAAGNVNGKILCDGKPAGAESGATVIVGQRATGMANSRRVQADGSFQVPGAVRGPNLVMLMTAGEGCMVRRVLWNGAALKDHVIELGEADVNGVVIESVGGLGEVRGFVRQGEKGVAGAMVYLAPVVDSEMLVDYPSFMSDSDGSFGFRRVAPGDYWLYAVDRENFAYADRKVIAPYLKKAERVTVTAKGKVVRDVVVQ